MIFYTKNQTLKSSKSLLVHLLRNCMPLRLRALAIWRSIACHWEKISTFSCSLSVLIFSTSSTMFAIFVEKSPTMDLWAPGRTE